MADAFKPRFADLVRNYTSTIGTGNFALGEAVTGYRDFASEIQEGESFYYSVVGIDKPQEFEVGRGTMQVDGTISRDPLNGVPTDFTSGYKSIAVVAAAEWFEAVQVGSAMGAAAAPNRQALAALADTTRPAFLFEQRREGLFAFDPSDRSAEVALDPLQGVYVAPSSEPSGASGAWVRRYAGPVIVSWFGAVGDAATDDHAAVQAAMDLVVPNWGSVLVPSGTFLVSRPLAIPDGVVLEGTGNSSMLYSINAAGEPWVIDRLGGADFTIRKLAMVPANAGAAIRLAQCSRAKIDDIVVAGQANGTGIYLFDCDNVVVDKLYFDGSAASKQGTAVYNSGGQNCKVVNCHAINCFAGFTISGASVDSDITPVEFPRQTADTYGNVIANCTVRNCRTQAFTITGSTYNSVANCHAEDYAGVSTHKAFQCKDVSGDETRGNIFVGCTARNYPAGFGAQETSHTQFFGCTTRDNSTNAFEFNAASKCQVIGCSAYEFGEAGILLSKTSLCTFDGVKLETSSATAIGIKDPDTGASQANNFDNITTLSTLAKFIDIAAGSNDNRFGVGCRSNDNEIVDASQTAVWPVVRTTPMVNLNSAVTTVASYMHRGMQVVSARWVTVAAVGGNPQVAIGRVGAATALGELQSVSGVSGSSTPLTLSTQLLTTAAILSGTVGVTGTGTGFFHFEGLPRL